MNKRKNMFFLYTSIALAIIASVLYHLSQKGTPANVNFAVSLLVTYFVSTCLAFLMIFFFPARNNLIAELQKLNWASYLLAFSIVGIEVGFLLAYRSGWNIGTVVVLVNVGASLILIPIALLFFREKLSWINILGVAICLLGLVLINWKR